MTASGTAGLIGGNGLPLRPLRFAFLGRTSEEELQDPSISLPRQFDSCRPVVEMAGGAIVRHYWDIESGRKQLEARGTGADGDAFGVTLPRDGGLPELLADAGAGLFDAVIAESIDRVARMTLESTQVERQLAERDLLLVCSDEPFAQNATTILTRRVKQATSEWYVLNLLELSRKGMVASVDQGWHAGGPPPYGFQLEEHPHPNPHKAREGKRKHRLVVDPLRGPVVALIFDWYCTGALGLGEICDRLNADPERFPPPQSRRRRPGKPARWTKPTLRELLRNPKYTGFNVWNRHDKRRGRPTLRPRSDWIWSSEQTHPALVSRGLYEQVQPRAEQNERRRQSGLQEYAGARPRGERFYVLRSRVFCDLCGRRLEGSFQKGKHYLRCLSAQRQDADAVAQAGHPRSLQVQQQRLLDELLDVLARRVFGPERLRLLRDELAGVAQGPWSGEAKLARLQEKLAETEEAMANQALAFDAYPPEHPVARQAARRIEELDATAIRLRDQIALLEEQRPVGPDPAELEALLAGIPDLRPALAAMSEQELAELLELFGVTARYNHLAKTLAVTVTLAPELAQLAETERPPGGGRRKSVIAGAGFEPATSGL